MLTQQQYDTLVERAEGFAFTSLQYPDYDGHRDYQVLYDGENGLLLAEMELSPSPVHWAANGEKELLALLALAPENITVPFVPKEFQQPLADAGFFVLGEFADFFNFKLVETAKTFTPQEAELLRTDEAEAASALSKAVRGQSRGFMGETAQWFTEWMEDGDVLVVREGGELAGVCCVTVYNSGTTLWVREIAISPAHQGKGYGRRLMEQALVYGARRGAVKAFLAADLQNTNAIALYESCGFARHGTETELQMARGNF